MFGVQNSQAKLQSLAHPKVGVLYKMFHVSVSERLLAFVIARRPWQVHAPYPRLGVGVLDTCSSPSILLQYFLLFRAL